MGLFTSTLMLARKEATAFSASRRSGISVTLPRTRFLYLRVPGWCRHTSETPIRPARFCASVSKDFLVGKRLMLFSLHGALMAIFMVLAGGRFFFSFLLLSTPRQ